MPLKLKNPITTYKWDGIVHCGYKGQPIRYSVPGVSEIRITKQPTVYSNGFGLKDWAFCFSVAPEFALRQQWSEVVRYLCKHLHAVFLGFVGARMNDVLVTVTFSSAFNRETVLYEFSANVDHTVYDFS